MDTVFLQFKKCSGVWIWFQSAGTFLPKIGVFNSMKFWLKNLVSKYDVPLKVHTGCKNYAKLYSLLMWVVYGNKISPRASSTLSCAPLW